VTERKEANRGIGKERDKFVKIAATAPGLIYSMRQNKDGSLSLCKRCYYRYLWVGIEEVEKKMQ
jgi:hypothetical protein